MTKYAVLSDIHSNIYALQAIVADAREQNVNGFINLGDILYGPIAPRATYDYLQELGAITISGNQDRQIYCSSADEIANNPTMQFILADLGPQPLAWMKDLPFDLHINEQIYACHGTPQSDLVYLLENVSDGFPKLKSDGEILAQLNGISSALILCGHTHIPRCVELSTGQLVINPGSVGLPAYRDDEPCHHAMETFSSRASYVIIEQQLEQNWQVAFRKVSYDASLAAQKAQNQGRLDWYQALTTGRC